MKPCVSCPVCNQTKLKRLGKHTAEVIEPPKNVQQAGTNVILERIIQKKTHETETIFCRKCKHVFLSPTFEEHEIELFYSRETEVEIKKQYRESEKASGHLWAEQHGIDPAEQQMLLNRSSKERPRRLFELVTQHTSRTGEKFRKICDIGGGSGELTAFFADSNRFVYDKNIQALSEGDITPLGNMDEFKENGPYDLFILSHVLEHIPFPVQFLSSFWGGLREGGAVYVEVPIEYPGSVIKRRGIPIGGHIQYFSMRSLCKCLKESGLCSVGYRKKEISFYGELLMPTLKVVSSFSQVGSSIDWRCFWPLEVAIDAFLVLKARKSNASLFSRKSI